MANLYYYLIHYLNEFTIYTSSCDIEIIIKLISMNWEEADNLDCAHFSGSERYVDSEIEGQINDEDIPTIPSTEGFTLESSGTATMYTNGGSDEGARYYRWKNGSNVRLEYWHSAEYGFYIAYGAEKIKMVVGNLQCHPFIACSSFSFGNSDGSTFDDRQTKLADPTPQSVRGLFNTKITEYVFNQKH